MLYITTELRSTVVHMIAAAAEADQGNCYKFVGYEDTLKYFQA